MNKQEKKDFDIKLKAERQEFKKQLKVLFDSNDDIIHDYSDLIRDENGKAHIYCNMRNGQEIFDPYSFNKFISTDVFDYIEKSTYYLRPSIPIVIEADVASDFSIEDEKAFRRHFVYYYNMDFEDKKRSIRRNRIISFLLLAVGIVLLAVYIIVANLWKDNVFNELISIFSWVFVWEATDRFCFHSTELKVECFNAGQLAIAELVFNRDKVVKK